MTPWEEFDIWMQQNNNKHLNDYGIQISKVEGYIIVDSPWPGHGDALTLSIWILCTETNELLELLDMGTYRDLNSLQPEALLNLYYSGNAMVFCTAGYETGIWFQKKGSKVIANIDGDDWFHEVQEDLIIPSDFLRYTVQYFQYVKTIKERGANNDCKN